MEIMAAQRLNGFCPQRLRRLGTALEREIEARRFPGFAVVVKHGDEVLVDQRWGFADSGCLKPLGNDAVFRLASMTKPLTSMLALMLVELGDLKLQDPIEAYLPELRNLKVDSDNGVPEKATRSPTIHDLLRHTAGYSYSLSGARLSRVQSLYLRSGVELLGADLSRDEALGRLADLPLAFQPGSRFEYGLSTDMLGWVIERLCGDTLGRVMSTRLLQPLGMTDTQFWLPRDQHARLADAFDSDPLKPLIWHWVRGLDDPEGRRYESGGGGLLSTTSDYLRFLDAIHASARGASYAPLSAATARWMLSDHLGSIPHNLDDLHGAGHGFGLGFAVRLSDGLSPTPGFAGEAGWAGASGPMFFVDPRREISVICMAQGPSHRQRLRSLIRSLVWGAWCGTS